MDQYNKEASRLLFQYYNPGYNPSSRSTLRQIDLHEQYVKGAKTYVIDHIVHCTNAGLNTTRIICGRGAHSEDGESKLRPAILEILRENGFTGAVHSQGGAIKVHLK